MDIHIENEIKRKIVKGINDGLINARNSSLSNFTVTNNRRHMEKWDNINDSITNLLSNSEQFIVVQLGRGIFTLIMILDTYQKVLYTIMKNKNFEKLLSRNSISNPHYIDSMLDFNFHFKEDPNQMCIEGLEVEMNNDKIKRLKQDICDLLKMKEIDRYITIVIDFKEYTLNKVEAITCSKFLEVLHRDNWSEYIDVDYNSIDFDEKNESENINKLPIKIKPKYNEFDVKIRQDIYAEDGN